VSDGVQISKQIPFGNDKQKGNGNSKDKKEGRLG